MPRWRQRGLEWTVGPGRWALCGPGEVGASKTPTRRGGGAGEEHGGGEGEVQVWGRGGRGRGVRGPGQGCVQRPWGQGLVFCDTLGLECLPF